MEAIGRKVVVRAFGSWYVGFVKKQTNKRITVRYATSKRWRDKILSLGCEFDMEAFFEFAEAPELRIHDFTNLPGKGEQP